MLHPLTVAKIGQELAISWSDGSESFLMLEVMRRHCPCAVCAGEPDMTGHVVRPSPHYNTTSFELANWKCVGGYAIEPRWGDGHASGLYSYALLRQLGK